MGRFTKADIRFHSDGGRRALAAVNVKVDMPWSDHARADLCHRVAEAQGADRPAEFTPDWIDQELTADQQDQWWQAACADGWAQLETATNDSDSGGGIFGRKVEIFSQGRSGGWAVVKGFDREAVAEWDAIAVMRWARFAKLARAIADDVPYQYYALIYLNVYCDPATGEPPVVRVWEGDNA